MKIEVKRDTLSAALSAVSGCVSEGDKASPTEGLVLIEFGDTEISFYASSKTNALRVKFYEEIGEFGSFVIQFKQLANAIKLMGEMISMESKNGWCFVKSEKTSLRVPSPSPDIFIGKKEKSGQRLPIASDVVLKAITFADMSTAKNDFANWALQCVFIDYDGKKFKTLGCDGHQVSRMIVQLETGIEPMTALITQKAVSGIAKMIQSTDPEMFALSKSGNDLVVEIVQDGASYTLWCRTAMGDFPAVETIIPNDSESVIVVNSKSLTNSIKKAQAFVADKSLVRMKFAENKITVESFDSNIGSLTDEIECEYNGAEFSADMYSVQILTALNKLGTDTVKMFFNGAKLPVKILPIGSDNDLVYVTMPGKFTEATEDLSNDAI